MSRKIFVVCILVSAFVALEACKGGGPPPMMAIRRLASGKKSEAANSSSDQGDVLDLENSLDKTLAVNEELKVALESNAGTGYEWKCEQLNDAFVSVDSTPEINPVDTGVVGGRVRTIYELRGKSVGATKITFDLVRSWEKNVAPVKTLTLTLTVTEAVAPQ